MELTVSLAKQTVEGWGGGGWRGIITREWLPFTMPGLKFSLHTEGYGPTRGTGIFVEGKNEIQVKWFQTRLILNFCDHLALVILDHE